MTDQVAWTTRQLGEKKRCWINKLHTPLSLGWCAVFARMKPSRPVDPVQSRCVFAIVHNCRRIRMAKLKSRQPGFFEWDGKGKHEEVMFSTQRGDNSLFPKI